MIYPGGWDFEGTSKETSKESWMVLWYPRGHYANKRLQTRLTNIDLPPPKRVLGDALESLIFHAMCCINTICL